MWLKKIMDWCVYSIKKTQRLLSIVLMCKLTKSDRRMLIQELLLNLSFDGCSCRTLFIRHRLSKVSSSIPTE
jgi:hypothetical protein